MQRFFTKKYFQCYLSKIYEHGTAQLTRFYGTGNSHYWYIPVPNSHDLFLLPSTCVQITPKRSFLYFFDKVLSQSVGKNRESLAKFSFSRFSCRPRTDHIFKELFDANLTELFFDDQPILG